MKTSLQRILLAVTASWTVLSFAALYYLQQQPMPVVAMASQACPPSSAPPSLAEASQTRDEELKPSDELLSALVYRTYPTRLSQWWEELLIRDFFEDKRDGFFVDVGSSHYKVRSTTHYIDVALGWHGVAIDAIAELAEGFEQHRPRTKFVGAFVGEKSDENVEFEIFTRNTRLSTADKELAESYKKGGAPSVTRELKTVSLSDVLDAQRVKQIDLLKMDIEMWEPAALRGFDIDRFKPKLVVLEMHEKVRDEILAYMAAHDYVKLERYMKWDGSGWFVPKADLPGFLARKAKDPLWREHLDREAGAQAPAPAPPTAPAAATP